MNRYRLKPRVKAGATQRAELLIYGDIGANWFEEESIEAKTIVTQLAELKGVPLDVRLNSYGGVVSDGLAIYNALKRYPGKTTAHIDGVAFSIASLIAMGADEIHMADNALLMIHAPWGAAIGNANDLREVADTLEITADAMAKSYLRPGGPDEATVAGWLNDGADHYFGADDALQAGLIDQISGTIDIAAALRGVRYQPPAAAGQTAKGEATMADTTNAPVGSPEPDDYMQSHNKAVQAALKKGAQIEAQRQREVGAVFDGLVPDDPMHPMYALRQRCLDDPGCDVAEANRLVIAQLRDRTSSPIWSPSPQPDNGGTYVASRPRREERLQMSRDGLDKLVEGATKALMIREGLERDQNVIKSEAGSEFRSMSLTEIAKACAHHEGITTHGSKEAVLRRVLAAGPGQGTGHFPAILENIANKGVMEGYQQAEETWSQWTVPGTLQDYRQATRVNKSLFDKLDLMYEGQEFQTGKFKDVKQAIQGYLHGKEFSLTLQSMVNDDLGMLVADTMAWGEAANVTIGDAVFTVLTVAGSGGYGQTMTEDSVILFHSTHANYIASGSGGAPASATIAAGRTAMAAQTDPNSRILGIRPRYILHGTALTPTVWPLLTSENVITGASSTLPERNWVANAGLTSVEEYRFDNFVSTAWMLAARQRTVEVAFVGGQRTPIVDRMPISNIPGVSWQISIPFGVAALDYRTFYLNYGA